MPKNAPLIIKPCRVVVNWSRVGGRRCNLDWAAYPRLLSGYGKQGVRTLSIRVHTYVEVVWVLGCVLPQRTVCVDSAFMKRKKPVGC